MQLAPLLLALLSSGAQMPDSQRCKIPASVEAAVNVRALNQEYIDAARAHDADWFRAHMAENVIVILGSGRRLHKAEFLSMLGDRSKPYRSLTVRDVTVRVFGPAVQVDADAPWELADGSRGVSRYIDTYAWIDCRWQVISAQITLLPPVVERQQAASEASGTVHAQ
jgi:hypothetical protein